MQMNKWRLAACLLFPCACAAFAQDKLVLQRAAIVDAGVELSADLKECDVENRLGGRIFDEAKRRSRRIPVEEPSAARPSCARSW